MWYIFWDTQYNRIKPKSLVSSWNALPSKEVFHLVQSCLIYRICMSKDSARSIGHVGHLFPKKYCITCKKSTLIQDKHTENIISMSPISSNSQVIRKKIFGELRWIQMTFLRCCFYVFDEKLSPRTFTMESVERSPRRQRTRPCRRCQCPAAEWWDVGRQTGSPATQTDSSAQCPSEKMEGGWVGDYVATIVICSGEARICHIVSIKVNLPRTIRLKYVTKSPIFKKRWVESHSVKFRDVCLTLLLVGGGRGSRIGPRLVFLLSTENGLKMRTWNFLTFLTHSLGMLHQIFEFLLCAEAPPGPLSRGHVCQVSDNFFRKL